MRTSDEVDRVVDSRVGDKIWCQKCLTRRSRLEFGSGLCLKCECKSRPSDLFVIEGQFDDFYVVCGGCQAQYPYSTPAGSIERFRETAEEFNHSVFCESCHWDGDQVLNIYEVGDKVDLSKDFIVMTGHTQWHFSKFVKILDGDESLIAPDEYWRGGIPVINSSHEVIMLKDHKNLVSERDSECMST